ncbi:MAG: peptidoglycan DD-metalloendopeptidase family protein [Chloroflexi bacterium]|nr:peptidoglycan DD-metalloendopeptidase family protein [Chloroflexota bacterium]
MNEKQQSEQLERFILDLHDNEHALPDEELDEELADFTRILVTHREENEMAKQRVWTNITGRRGVNFQKWLVLAAAILTLVIAGSILFIPEKSLQLAQGPQNTPTVHEMTATKTPSATSTPVPTQTLQPTEQSTSTLNSQMLTATSIILTFEASQGTLYPTQAVGEELEVTSTPTPDFQTIEHDMTATARPETISDQALTATAIITTFEASQGTFAPEYPTSSTPTPIPPEVVDEQLPLSVTLNLNRIEFVNQTWNNGGPAALSMLLSYFDVDISQDEIAQYLRPNPEDKNTTFEEISNYLRRTDTAAPLTETSIVGGNERVLKRAVGLGYPVLVATGYEVDESLDWFAQYLLVVGYDEDSFLIYDSYLGGADEVPLHIPYDEFDAQWQDMNRPLMLVYPSQDNLTIQSIIGDYANRTSAAQNAMQNAVEDLAADSEDGWAWFNLGETLLAMGSNGAAVTAFDRALELELPWRALWYRTSIFEAYLLQQRYDDIFELTDKMLRTTGDVEEMHIYQALAYRAQGLTEEADRSTEQALELNPNHPLLDILVLQPTLETFADCEINDIPISGLPEIRPLSVGQITDTRFDVERGINWYAPEGTQVLAAGSGIVVESGWNTQGLGAVATIAHRYGSEVIYSRYGHLSQKFVACGEWVEMGQPIGTVGSTGTNAIPNLYFELFDAVLHEIDPEAYFNR